MPNIGLQWGDLGYWRHLQLSATSRAVELGFKNVGC